jgi:hypothetical protein
MLSLHIFTVNLRLCICLCLFRASPSDLLSIPTECDRGKELSKEELE